MREELRLVITAENYAAWFAPTVAVTYEEPDLTIGAPTRFRAEWLDSRLRGRVESSLRRLGHGDVRVHFVVL